MTDRPLHALTLHQPWASLLALGQKRYDPHPVKPSAGAVGESLAIFAHPKEPPATLHEAMSRSLHRAGLEVDQLPLGAFIAIVTMHEPKPADEIARGLIAEASPNMPDEMHLGSFEQGMWAWRFGNRRPLAPVSWRGERLAGPDGLWQVPAPVIERVRVAYREAGHLTTTPTEGETT